MSYANIVKGILYITKMQTERNILELDNSDAAAECATMDIACAEYDAHWEHVAVAVDSERSIQDWNHVKKASPKRTWYNRKHRAQASLRLEQAKAECARIDFDAQFAEAEIVIRSLGVYRALMVDSPVISAREGL